MAYHLSLLFALIAFWLGMSGHYTPRLLALGGVSIAVTMILASRLRVVDRDGAPYGRIFGYLGYIPWLLREIARANWTVTGACLRPDLDIDPALVTVKTRCRSDLAKVTFANSITLTPGTVAVEVEGDEVLVHGLYARDSGPDAFAEMDARSARAADGRKAGT